MSSLGQMELARLDGWDDILRKRRSRRRWIFAWATPLTTMAISAVGVVALRPYEGWEPDTLLLLPGGITGNVLRLCLLVLILLCGAFLFLLPAMWLSARRGGPWAFVAWLFLLPPAAYLGLCGCLGALVVLISSDDSHVRIRLTDHDVVIREFTTLDAERDYHAWTGGPYVFTDAGVSELDTIYLEHDKGTPIADGRYTVTESNGTAFLTFAGHTVPLP